MGTEEIIDVMSKSEGCRIKCVENNGDEWTGVVDTYESDYDNEGDDCEGHSICVRRDDGANVIVYDAEIESITIIE